MAGRITKRPNGFGLGTRVTKKSGFGTRVTKKSGFGTRVTKKSGFGTRVTKKSGFGTRVTKKFGFGTRVTKKSGFGTRVTRKQSDPREDITSNIDDLGKASNEEASLLAPNIATTDETKDYSEDLLAMWHRCRDGGILPGIYGCENMMDPEEGSEIITEENNSDQYFAD